MALGYLRQVPTEIAVDLRRARTINDPDLRLDTFFFSCLGLSQSAFYIIDQESLHKNAIREWRMNALDEKGRAKFNRMMSLRDNDVHHGRSDGKTLATMIPIERGGGDDAWRYQQQRNYAVLGINRPVTEHKNPDGSTASSYEGLQGSMCLYFEIAGETCEASNACAWFIAQLSQLIDAVGVVPVLPRPMA